MDSEEDWRGKDWKMQDFDELVTNARSWTANTVRGIGKTMRNVPQPAGTHPAPAAITVSHAWLQERYQVSEDPQRRSVLSNLTLFLRHVALWEHEVAGTVM